MPVTGAFVATMTVRLLPVGQRESDSAQLVRLRVDADAMVYDRAGVGTLLSKAAQPYNLHAQPFYYYQAFQCAVSLQ